VRRGPQAGHGEAPGADHGVKRARSLFNPRSGALQRNDHFTGMHLIGLRQAIQPGVEGVILEVDAAHGYTCCAGVTR